MEIKYSYAKDLDGHIVHIEDAFQGGIYYCPQCGNEMIPKMGDINAHHFAHKVECSCNGESYLHKIAKLKFKEIYDKSSQFILEYRKPIKCPHNRDSHSCIFANNDCNSYSTTVYTMNLKAVFDECLIEAPVNAGQFCADILLRDSSGKCTKLLLIEFYHTHKCESDKIESGYPIVEIRINNEDDLITSNRIPFSDKISLYGFKGEPSKGKELYFVSFEDDRCASDIKIEKSNCIEVFNTNYNDYYECRCAFAVVIDPLSYYEFTLEPKFRKHTPSVGKLACAIAYSRGFRTFDNCAACANCKRSKFNEVDLWCAKSKEDSELPKNPKDVDVYFCKHFIPNNKRLEYIGEHLKNLKYKVLRSDLRNYSANRL